MDPDDPQPTQPSPPAPRRRRASPGADPGGPGAPGAAGDGHRTGDRSRGVFGRSTEPFGIHPGLIPGISVEETDARFPTRRSVFVIALLVTVAIVIWAFLSPASINQIGTGMQSWVVTHFGWLFNAVVVIAVGYMFVVGYGPTGRIRLGSDHSRPEYSTASWISMLFAAGLGIGLMFYGPLEPLTHFLEPPPAADGEAATMDAVTPALTHAILHQATFAWCIYALVGGALAYASYRRGRLPLISAIFEPTLPDSSNRVLGKVIDIFAILVTLFGTATSLGIGALQIRTGTSIVTGQPLESNAFVVTAISLLTVVAVISAVTGIKKGIRLLSNINMVLVIAIATFVLIAGPTLFLLDLMPATVIAFLGSLPQMLTVFASQGQTEQEWLTIWTTLFWAWWISWSPFVGMFIAKISKGRTLRQYVTVVVFVPVAISILWYVVLGGTAMSMNLRGQDMTVEDSGENVLFDLLGNLPLSGVLWVVALVAILIFFVTAADSATNVMGSMSQSGRPVASRPVTIVWGTGLGLIALFLLLAGGENALSGLQSIMVTGALPFVFVLLGIMISWAKDLHDDPLMIRRRYALEAIRRGVHRGIDEHGDDFVFGTSLVDRSEGAGADFESGDPALVEWYTEHAAVHERTEDPGQRTDQGDEQPGPGDRDS